MSESLAIEQFIYSALQPLTTATEEQPALATGVHAYFAPEGSPFPYIVFQQQSARDVSAIGAIRVMSNAVYVVKVISDKPFSAIDPIVDEVDKALQATFGPALAGSIYSCVRSAPFSMVENLDGKRINHRGGIYRISASTRT